MQSPLQPRDYKAFTPVIPESLMSCFPAQKATSTPNMHRNGSEHPMDGLMLAGAYSETGVPLFNPDGTHPEAMVDFLTPSSEYGDLLSMDDMDKWAFSSGSSPYAADFNKMVAPYNDDSTSFMDEVKALVNEVYETESEKIAVLSAFANKVGEQNLTTTTYKNTVIGKDIGGKELFSDTKTLGSFTGFDFPNSSDEMFELLDHFQMKYGETLDEFLHSDIGKGSTKFLKNLPWLGDAIDYGTLGYEIYSADPNQRNAVATAGIADNLATGAAFIGGFKTVGFTAATRLPPTFVASPLGAITVGSLALVGGIGSAYLYQQGVSSPDGMDFKGFVQDQAQRFNDSGVINHSETLYDDAVNYWNKKLFGDN